MLVACNKCHAITRQDEISDWLTVNALATSYLLCPKCKEGFWMAVDRRLPYLLPSKDNDEYIMSLQTTIFENQQTIEDLRNELCLKCGAYINSHLGACNGCRWRKDDG